MPKKKTRKGKPEVHDELQGFDIRINAFGEIVSSFDVDELNTFLNERVSDKKLPAGDDQSEEE